MMTAQTSQLFLRNFKVQNTIEMEGVLKDREGGGTVTDISKI